MSTRLYLNIYRRSYNGDGSMETGYDDTIAAISTGMAGSAGIGIVRLSGPEAFEIADQVYRGSKSAEGLEASKRLTQQQTHTIHYGYVADGDETIDEVLFMLMCAPHTYTGEDTVEIDCHGGNYVTRRVLETVVKYGARPAEPGEFSKRAFLNGKMDLSQAEAVGDLISAQNEYALESSVHQLRGNLKKKISDIRNKIIYESAYIESALDDPEHYSLEGYAGELAKTVDELLEEIGQLLSSFDDGRIIKEGIKTVILGRPNAGKSSLLNALTGQDRAIVTEIAGTTRDVLEEQLNLQGISLHVVDTAGIHDTEDLIEKIGVDKAEEQAKTADLILYVIDASEPLDQDDEQILKLIAGKTAIILLNKSDLDTVVDEDTIKEAYFATNPANNSGEKTREIPEIVSISAKTLEGIEELEEVLKSMFFAGNLSFNDEIYITNIRQKDELNKAYKALTKVRESIDNGMPEDLYTIDLLDAYEALGRITGETVGDDLADEIFSKFCMGK